MARRGPRGSRWLRVSHVFYDNLIVLLILQDGREGCNGSNDVRRVRILLDCKKGFTRVEMATSVARALG